MSDMNMVGTAADPNTPSPDERQAARERTQESATKPGGFKNDPDDASNPNEVRERHLEKVKESSGI